MPALGRSQVHGGSAIPMTTKPRRRQAGEGSLSEYATKAGPRFLIKFQPSGTGRSAWSSSVASRPGRTPPRLCARKSARPRWGEWVEPSKQRLDAYLVEWVQGQRLRPSTLASYRLHIE